MLFEDLIPLNELEIDGKKVDDDNEITDYTAENDDDNQDDDTDNLVNQDDIDYEDDLDDWRCIRRRSNR